MICGLTVLQRLASESLPSLAASQVALRGKYAAPRHRSAGLHRKRPEIDAPARLDARRTGSPRTTSERAGDDEDRVRPGVLRRQGRPGRRPRKIRSNCHDRLRRLAQRLRRQGVLALREAHQSEIGREEGRAGPGGVFTGRHEYWGHAAVQVTSVISLWCDGLSQVGGQGRIDHPAERQSLWKQAHRW